MSLQSMITGANLPIGDPASLFKNPAQAGLDALGVSQGGMGGLATAMQFTDPLFDPTAIFATMTAGATDITAGLTAKVSTLATDLSTALSAANIQKSIASVDPLLNNTLTGIPNQIDNAFSAPAVCPDDHIKNSFKSVTESNALVASSNDAIAAQFDNTGPMSTLFTALNALPGVAISTGKELLDLMNTGGAAVQAAAAAAIASSGPLLTQLKSSFTDTTSKVNDMTAGFSNLVQQSSDALEEATKVLTGNNVVSRIASNNSCIQSVMSSCVNPAKVDGTALALQAGQKDGTIVLPGQQSVSLVNSKAEAPTFNAAIVPAANMVVPPVAGPSIVRYTSSEISAFQENIRQQNIDGKALAKASAEWMKTNVEEWRTQVQYYLKKKNANATESNPLGDSPNPVYLEEWRLIYNVTPDPNNWLWKKNHYDTVLRPAMVAALKKLEESDSEYKQRTSYGKYPYTFQIAQGLTIPEEKQYTWLDSTK